MTEQLSPQHYKRTQVYLDNQYDKPKYMFQKLGDVIEGVTSFTPASRLLDVGGAIGEFAYYVKKRFPPLNVTFLEYDAELVARAKAQLENIEVVQGDANYMEMLADQTFDLTTMIGVMSIFDDYRTSLSECLRVTKSGGYVFVIGLFNSYPIDALIRWRYADSDTPYHSGYNMVSVKTISRFLEEHNRVSEWQFEDFHLPFDLKQQDDLIRTWTEVDKEGMRYLRNGLLPMVDLKILTINLK